MDLSPIDRLLPQTLIYFIQERVPEGTTRPLWHVDKGGTFEIQMRFVRVSHFRWTVTCPNTRETDSGGREFLGNFYFPRINREKIENRRRWHRNYLLDEMVFGLWFILVDCHVYKLTCHRSRQTWNLRNIFIFLE